MAALKSIGAKPLPILAKATEPRKNPPFPHVPPLKNQPFPNFSIYRVSRTFQGGFVFLSSFLTSESAKALTYDESPIDFDTAVRFAAENPIITGGAVAVVAVPAVVAQLLGKPRPWGVVNAKTAYAKLGDDANAQLLDIRPAAEIKSVGGPDVRELKKKAVAVVYREEDKAAFLKRLSLKFKEPGNTTLFILDKFDGNSELVAQMLTSNGFKAAYAIKDGAEGTRGWLNSGLPWMLPKKTLDLSSLTDAIGDAFGEASDTVPVALGLAAAAAGLGILAFVEVETILQILGSAALVQFASKKLLFAEDRKKTIQEIEELLNTKVAPKELVDDIQQIGKVLLPLPANGNALPTPPETTLTPTPSESTVLKSESTSEVTDVPTKAEADVEQECPPVVTRPLSPYPNYPDYKPPSSPIPSQP